MDGAEANDSAACLQIKPPDTRACNPLPVGSPCDDGNNPAAELDIWGWSELENNCVLEEVEYYDYDFSYTFQVIANGTC